MPLISPEAERLNKASSGQDVIRNDYSIITIITEKQKQRVRRSLLVMPNAFDLRCNLQAVQCAYT